MCKDGELYNYIRSIRFSRIAAVQHRNASAHGWPLTQHASFKLLSLSNFIGFVRSGRRSGRSLAAVWPGMDIQINSGGLPISQGFVGILKRFYNKVPTLTPSKLTAASRTVPTSGPDLFCRRNSFSPQLAERIQTWLLQAR